MPFSYLKKLNPWTERWSDRRPEEDFKAFPGDEDIVYSERGGSEDEPLAGERVYYLKELWKRPSLHPYWAVIFHLGVMCVYTTLFFTAAKPSSQCRDARSRIVQSPANEAVILEPQIYNSSLCIDTPFMGPPSPETDQAWADLLQYSHLRLSREELRRIDQTSIPLPDEEDAYWGMLGATHELHCLKRLRQYMYKDHYFPNLTPQEEMLNLLHSGHCIEILRQAAMCRGDVSITMYWRDDVEMPIADFTLPHSCVNWNAIQDWSEKRSFDPMKPGYMRHPELGK
ncbi:hypothetical protein TOPH_04039 [Tolypocladium ophioglossoides CBS 100239]|uniref:Cyclochlorotine biosynthesis protein O n=1 Tax=Tolypocladium ophioglossoides (strain CBS 100239) TaxID=1163406 RepID=A0A0L0NBP7_TOLOC|nr:hypothetical protein TOPH_04039 [Tolypocladium ophioglossoides CBS 100239]